IPFNFSPWVERLKARFGVGPPPFHLSGPALKSSQAPHCLSDGSERWTTIMSREYKLGGERRSAKEGRRAIAVNSSTLRVIGEARFDVLRSGGPALNQSGSTNVFSRMSRLHFGHFAGCSRT